MPLPLDMRRIRIEYILVGQCITGSKMQNTSDVKKGFYRFPIFFAQFRLSSDISLRTRQPLAGSQPGSSGLLQACRQSSKVESRVSEGDGCWTLSMSSGLQAIANEEQQSQLDCH
jgi:hypothetical protein